MENTIPELPKDGRYSIKETCEMLSIHRNSLRKYYPNEEFSKSCKIVC